MGVTWYRYMSDRRGAATADYVVLAAALIGLVLSVINAVNLGSVEGVTHITDAIKEAEMIACSGTTGQSVGRCDN